jgi:hypothetical protein
MAKSNAGDSYSGTALVHLGETPGSPTIFVQLDKLKSHQIAPAQHLLAVLGRYQSAVDISDMGTGKTYVAAAVASSLQIPTLVIAPKVALTTWDTAAAHFNDKFSILNYEMLRTGRTPFGTWEKNPDAVSKADRIIFVCQCCQQTIDFQNLQNCSAHPYGVHCVINKVKARSYGKFNFRRGVGLLIFDEGHRCGGLNSLNAEMMMAAKRQGIKTLVLSATAACTPLQMRALGYLFDLHGDKAVRFASNLGQTIRPAGPSAIQTSIPDFYTWARRYGCRELPGFRGLHWLVSAQRQREIMAEIRDRIIPARGVRVTTDDIPGFPECQIEAHLYDLEENNQINALYAEMAVALQCLDEKSAKDKASDHPLTVILRARQKIELLKVPIAVEIASDLIAKGYSVPIFVNFDQTRLELMRRLGTTCSIHGGQSRSDRDSVVNLFQSNVERSMVLNAEAGGECLSLHDCDGFHPRAGLVFPNFSARSMRQIFGRLPRVIGKSKSFYRVLFAAGTCEVPMHRAVSAKLNCLDALNDSDLQPENLRLEKTTRNRTIGY